MSYQKKGMRNLELEIIPLSEFKFPQLHKDKSRKLSEQKSRKLSEQKSFNIKI
jgi:hypothetical protein